MTKKLLLAFGLILVLDLLWLWYAYTQPVQKNSSPEIHFAIVKGETSQDIARKLAEQGLIRSPLLFRAYTFLSGIANDLKAGEYILTPSMRMPEIALHFFNGDSIQQEIRVLEGWSLKNIANEFEKQGLFSQDEFFSVTGTPGIDYRENEETQKPKDFSEEFAFLKEKPPYVSLEGYLFPDTYHIAKGDTPEDIVRRMMKNFERKVGQSVSFEQLIMASIIEKEVRSLEDKKLVSGILWKRLENNMRLQVDATIVYIRDGNYYKVTTEETKIDSPYNTYQHDGLPPGPISNPGLESIEAALHPTESPYWFYSSPSINETIFSKTFEEHKEAANLYVR